MAPRPDQLCPKTLFYSVSRESNEVFSWFCISLFDRLVKRIIREFRVSEESAFDLASVALSKVLSDPLSKQRNRSFYEFLAYCALIASRTTLDSIKRERAQKRGGVLPKSLEELGDELIIQADTIWAGANTTGIQMSDLLEAMGRLTDDERTVIVCHYVEGETLESIAKNRFPGTSKSTVFDWKQRALNKLRAALE
jgi:RNA polymerase sigma factor (sigma-70 family)